MTLLVHILAGGLGLFAGFIALYAAKGATLHRKAGIVFVYAMLATGIGGLVIAVVRGVAPAINIPAVLLTASLVITSLTTVRPPSAGARWLDLAPMLVALAVGLTSLMLARMFPGPIRPALIALPLLAVLLTMFFWLWRVRRRTFRPERIAEGA